MNHVTRNDQKKDKNPFFLRSIQISWHVQLQKSTKQI